MSSTTNTKQATPTPDLTPEQAEHLKILDRQRKRAARYLLKRRQAKSGQ